MGRNNNEYRAKNKILTQNKRNRKRNKAIAFTLAAITTGTAGVTIISTDQTNAMMKAPKTSHSLNKPLGTSRLLNGSRGSINTGAVTSNGTQYQGLPGTNSAVKNPSYPSKPSKTSTTSTSRLLNGSRSSINTGATTSNGSQYQGLPGTNSAVKNPSYPSKPSKTSTTSTSRLLNGSRGSINTGVTTSNGTQYQGTPRTASEVKNLSQKSSTTTKVSNANTSRSLNGSKGSINTGVTTSNGTQYQGTPKTASEVKNLSQKSSTTTKVSNANTSRGLNGSKGSINTGVTTSNGTKYQGTPRTSTLVDNSKMSPEANKNTSTTKASTSKLTKR